MLSLSITIIFLTVKLSAGEYPDIGQSEVRSCSIGDSQTSVICRKSSDDEKNWICQADGSRIVEIKENFLLTTCNLGKIFHLSFDLFVKNFKKKRNILNIVTSEGIDIISIKTGKRQKLKIKGLVRPHALILPLNQWNSLKISQEQHGNFVSLL